MRVLAVLLLIIFAVAGIAFGALNPDLVRYDLGFTHLALPKGAALIGALVLGWILGGVLVWLLSAHPAQRRLARAQRAPLAVTAQRSGDTGKAKP